MPRGRPQHVLRAGTPTARVPDKYWNDTAKYKNNYAQILSNRLLVFADPGNSSVTLYAGRFGMGRDWVFDGGLIQEIADAVAYRLDAAFGREVRLVVTVDYIGPSTYLTKLPADASIAGATHHLDIMRKEYGRFLAMKFLKGSPQPGYLNLYSYLAERDSVPTLSDIGVAAAMRMFNVPAKEIFFGRSVNKLPLDLPSGAVLPMFEQAWQGYAPHRLDFEYISRPWETAFPDDGTVYIVHVKGGSPDAPPFLAKDPRFKKFLDDRPIVGLEEHQRRIRALMQA
jgi:hypothetical protein